MKANSERIHAGEDDYGYNSETLPSACLQALEAFDRGYRFQKWFFKKGSKDGAAGMKENIELVRVLREELPDGGMGLRMPTEPGLS